MTEANTINMEELYYKGLEPIDFARYTSPLPTEQFEELASLGIGAERYGLEPTQSTRGSRTSFPTAKPA